MGELVGIIIIFVIGGVPCYFLVRWSMKKTSEINNNKERFGATMYAALKHNTGLPVAEGVEVTLYYGPEKLVFIKDKREISISRNKITSLDCVTGKDITTQAATGAIAGKYILGGVTGAVIGSLAASKMYFVITYKNDDENKYIILDTYVSGGTVNKMIKDFKKNDTSEPVSIEL